MRAARLLVLLAILVALGGITSHRVTTAQSSGAYIALGDSIAAGFGSSLPERRSYPALVHDLLETFHGATVPFTNLGVPGETARSFIEGGQLDALAGEVSDSRMAVVSIDVVTLTLGGNEMLAQRERGATERRQALDEFRESYDDAVAGVRTEIGDVPTLILTTYYDLSEGDPAQQSTDAWWVEQFNSVIRDTAARHGAIVAELYEPFRGRIDEYTNNPYDVHPNNQGYRAIARQVWHVLGLDTETPAVQVTSNSEATRRTPTLQMAVTDNVDVSQVRVTVSAGPPHSPVEVADGRYALLLDLRGDNATGYPIVIEAEDSAGNVTQIEHHVTIQAD